MALTSPPISSTQALRALCIGVLGIGLCLFGNACNSVGSGGEAPDAPSGLTGASGDSVIELRWEAVGGAETYNVYRDTSSIGTSAEPLTEGLSPPRYDDTGADNGTTYFYRVTAVGASGNESEMSGEIEKTPFSAPPDSP